MPRIKMSLSDTSEFLLLVWIVLRTMQHESPYAYVLKVPEHLSFTQAKQTVFESVQHYYYFESLWNKCVCSVALFCRFGTTRLGISSVPWRVTLTRCRTSPLIRLESCWLLALRTWPSNSGTSRALSASGPCTVHISCIYYHFSNLLLEELP